MNSHPRALLFFAKLTIIGIAFCFEPSYRSLYVNLSYGLLVFAVISLHPRFGWLVPMTVLGALAGLATPYRVNWNPADDFTQLAILTIGGFGVGCIADLIAQRQKE